MKLSLITMLLVLVSCQEANQKQDVVVQSIWDMSCEEDLTRKQRFTTKRCENKEVICYIVSSNSPFCKFKEPQ